MLTLQEMAYKLIESGIEDLERNLEIMGSWLAGDTVQVSNAVRELMMDSYDIQTELEAKKKLTDNEFRIEACRDAISTLEEQRGLPYIAKNKLLLARIDKAIAKYQTFLKRLEEIG